MNQEYLEHQRNYHNARDWFFVKARLHNIDERTIQAYKRASDEFFNYLSGELENRRDNGNIYKTTRNVFKDKRELTD